MRIAAILTCHNRKQKTLDCLKSLYEIVKDIDVFLTDDRSTDGTGEEVSNRFPNVKIIHGSGNLFWSRGMYTAWKEAIKKDYEYYLWLNDDVKLYSDFFTELFDCLHWGGNTCIVTGLIENEERRQVIYGGSDENKKLIQPSPIPQLVTYMNGNVVLVPKTVVDKIGIIDPVYHHDLGDVDYGLTAKENGIKVYATRKAVAMGYSNNFCRVRKWNTNLRGRFERLYSPLGANPQINFYYRHKHFGYFNALSYILFLYAINILPDTVIELLFKDKYKDEK